MANQKEAVDFTEKVSSEIKDYEGFQKYFANRSWKDLVENKGLEDFDFHEEKRKFLFTLYLEWCELPNSLDTIVFCGTFRLHEQWLYELAAKFPECRRMLDLGRLYISAKRRTDNYLKRLNDTIYKDMHRYDPSWAEVNKYHADLRKDNKVTGDIAIYLNGVKQTNIPHSDDKPVPEETPITNIGAD